MPRKRHTPSAPAGAPAALTPPDSPRRDWRVIRPEWVAAALVFLALGWIVTEGGWDFFGTVGRLEGFYDAQAESLLHGRIDVPEQAIEDEAFVRNGRNYGYFGPTPALFRLPLVVLFPSMNGKWSRWSMLVASAVMLWAVLLLIRRMEELQPALARAPSWIALRTALVLAAGIGSTQFFVCAESKVYQESIEWAASLALASAVCLLSFLMRRTTAWLVAACVTAFLAFFARVSSGVGPIVALAALEAALVLPHARLQSWCGLDAAPQRRNAIAALSATLVLTVTVWAGLNWWKFGMVFTGQPLQMNVLYDAARLRNIKGSLASLTNLPLTLTTYLSPANIGFIPGFPWVETTALSSDALRARFPSAHFDYCEWFVSLPDGMPALFFGALGGTVLCFSASGRKFRHLRAPLIGAVAGCALCFLWGLIAYRYLHDLFPWLALGTAIALTWIAGRQSAAARRGLAVVFLAATTWSMWANYAFALEHQRLHTWPISPAKRIEFVDLSGATAHKGLGAALDFWRQTRVYLSAKDIRSQQGMVGALGNRSDWPVVTSDAGAFHMADYEIEAPEPGVYELSIRYASAQPRPLLLKLNGTAVGYACAAGTGGDGEQFQRWMFAGKPRLMAGPLRINLSSAGPFPNLTFLRLVKVD